MVRCPMTIESLSHHIRSGEIIGKLDLHWGRNSFSENIIKSKVKYAKSISGMSLHETLHRPRTIHKYLLLT